MCGYCDCGPWGSIDLNGAFCYPVCVTDEGVPCIEFAFPQEDGSTELITPDTLDPETGKPVFTMRPDGTLDFCAPFKTGKCSGSWPAQDHCDPWTIRATIGCPPPKMLLMGAAKFACEMVKECLGEDNCLPDGVRSITRRGLTMDVGSGLEETINFETGGTGIPVLDLALVRWGCKEQTIATHFDPLQKYDEIARRCWTYRGRINPVPVSVDGC